MKALTNQFTLATNTSDKPLVVNKLYKVAERNEKESDSSKQVYPFIPNLEIGELIKEDALSQMIFGELPDISQVCYDLYRTFFKKESTNSALQFIPELRGMAALQNMEIERFLNNPQTNHVLIQNGLLKVVLIRWEPGKISSIHGHPAGGCVFKVLEGSVEELRYTTNESPQLLSSSHFHKEGIGYIDDQLGYHAVGNPYNTPAVTLHVYTPGFK